MKMSVILLMFVILQAGANEAYSQKAKVTIHAENAKLSEVLDEMERQTDYLFFYNKKNINANKRVNVQVTDTPVSEVLDKTLDADVAYGMVNEHVILSKKETVTAIAATFRQTPVTGTVTDANGEALPGVNVIIKGTTTGVVTDANGKFSINASSTDVLQISFVGYATQEIEVGDQTALNISLSEDSQALEEVVVVGYGTQKKRDLTGAISSVKIAEMPVQTYSTVSHALAGKAAGLQVTQNSAQVGGGTTFRIRGATSTGAGNDPLVIIDGIPVSSTAFEGSGNRYSAGSVDNILESLNPNDIESIDVLKDASATAIYGARAGHGVIIVTTKRGKNQKINVTYSGIASVQSMKNTYKMLTAQEYMSQRNKDNYEMYLQNNGLDVYKDYISLAPGHVAPAYVPMYSDAEIAAAQTTDWFDEVTRNGFQQSHNVSMNGGTESTQYMASLNYLNQKGVIKNNDMNRFTAKLNLDQQISKYVKAGLSFNLSRNKYDNVVLGGNRGENSGIIGSAITFNPTIPVYNANGEYSSNPEQSYLPNPVSLLEITDITTKDRVLGSAYTEVEPIKGLKLKAVLGVDRRSSKRNNYLPKTTKYGAAVNGQAFITERGDLDYLIDLTATYTKEINHHNFTALVGYSYQEFNAETFNAGNQDFILDAFLYNNLGVGAHPKPVAQSWASKSALGSYFGRLNYSFMGKYMLTATVRADGSSNFNSDHRWGYFPSASVGWRFSDENFMESLSSVLSNGKLRVGYGQTGNSNVGNRVMDTYRSATSYGGVFGDTYALGIRAAQMGNPKLTWETTTELNIGLDLGFFDNRINASLEYYDRTISDLLVTNKGIQAYNEITSIAANIGKTQGKGFEATLNTINITNRDFQWTTDISFSLYRDRWKERDPEWKPAVYQSATDPIRASFSNLSDGLLQAGEKAPEHQKALLPGQIKLKDISGEDGVPDGKLDNYDVVYIGTSDPDFYFGFNNTLKYKGFDFNIYFYGEINKLREATYYETLGIFGDASSRQAGANASRMALDSWHHDKQNATYPSPFLTAYSSGDYFTKKVNFLRCRNITAGYTIPVPKGIAQRVRVYADVNNPFVLTNYKTVDPETSDAGLFPYPNITSVSLGIDVTF